MIEYSLFIVDDERHIRNGIASSIDDNYNISTFETAEAALSAMADGVPDLVLLDIGLPGMDGIEALEEMKKIDPNLLVIMITAYEDVETVIRAMKLGAYDYVIKPIQLEAIEVSIRNALATIRLQKEVIKLQEAFLKEKVPCFISESEAIQDVMTFVTNVSRSPDTPILITGETGTGKELIAQAVHHRSPNFRGPLVSVNCSAIPRELVESELFGYEGGAFSGAAQGGKAGLIESAAGGTLFLDELGDLGLEAQAKLLRFLESGEFYKVGGTKIRKVQTRIVSATNRNLLEMIESNTFRKDLYYRLGVASVRIPLLKDRPKDILPLAHYFLDMYVKKFDIPFTGLSEDAEAWMFAHSWPGNIRELKNRIERGVLIGKPPTLKAGDLKIEDTRVQSAEPCSGEIDFPPGGIDFTAYMETLRKQYIEKALAIAEGNEAKAARLLKLNPHTFRYHCKKMRQT